MGLVSFLDSNGQRWRVWKVDTPSSRAHLMDVRYRDGWLVFEREDQSERRRLQQVPEDWATLPSQRLELLCEVAVPVAGARSLDTGQFKPSTRLPDNEPHRDR
jgi:hypothetical protein